jgi:predicted 2-oxoglutarate/Fe(II)-dependent dioxygenase YbiX
MDILDFVSVYKNVWPSAVGGPELICKSIMEHNYNYEPSTYSNHSGQVNPVKRVKMDEYWIRDSDQYYVEIKYTFNNVIKQYSEEHPLFSAQHMTDFRINRYSEGGFMSQHPDSIHHSHGQQYGYPHVTALLILNDDFEGGEFYLADKEFKLEKGSSIVFPSNFIYPHEVKVITKGTRWSILTWLM